MTIFAPSNALLELHIEDLYKRISSGCDDENGINLSKRDCQLLILRLKSSVDIAELIYAMHGLLSETILSWGKKINDESNQLDREIRRSEVRKKT